MIRAVIKHVTVAVLLLLNSCITMYIPYAVDIPLVEERGDNKIDAGISLDRLCYSISLFHKTYCH